MLIIDNSYYLFWLKWWSHFIFKKMSHSHSSMSEFYSNNSYLPPKKWLVKLASRNPHKCFLARHPPYFSMQQKYFMNTYHLGTLYKKDILKGQDLLKLTIFTAFSRTFLIETGFCFALLFYQEWQQWRTPWLLVELIVTALIWAKGQSTLSPTAFALSLQMPTQRKRQITSQCQ